MLFRFFFSSIFFATGAHFARRKRCCLSRGRLEAEPAPGRLLTSQRVALTGAPDEAAEEVDVAPAGVAMDAATLDASATDAAAAADALLASCLSDSGEPGKADAAAATGDEPSHHAALSQSSSTAILVTAEVDAGAGGSSGDGL